MTSLTKAELESRHLCNLKLFYVLIASTITHSRVHIIKITALVVQSGSD